MMFIGDVLIKLVYCFSCGSNLLYWMILDDRDMESGIGKSKSSPDDQPVQLFYVCESGCSSEAIVKTNC